MKEEEAEESQMRKNWILLVVDVSRYKTCATAQSDAVELEDYAVVLHK